MSKQYLPMIHILEVSKRSKVPTPLSNDTKIIPTYEMLFSWYRKFSKAPWRKLYDALIVQASGGTEWSIKDWEDRRYVEDRSDSYTTFPTFISESVHKPLSHKPADRGTVDLNTTLILNNKIYAPSFAIHQLVVDYISNYLSALSSCIKCDDISSIYPVTLASERILEEQVALKQKLVDAIASLNIKNKDDQEKKNESLVTGFTQEYIKQILSAIHLQLPKQENRTHNSQTVRDCLEEYINVISASQYPHVIHAYESKLYELRLAISSTIVRYDKDKQSELEKAKLNLSRSINTYTDPNKFNTYTNPTKLLKSLNDLTDFDLKLIALKQAVIKVKELFPEINLPELNVYSRQSYPSTKDNLFEYYSLVLAGNVVAASEFINTWRISKRLIDPLLLLKVAAYSGDIAAVQYAESNIESGASEIWKKLNFELIEKRVANTRPLPFSQNASYTDLAQWYARHASCKWILQYDNYCLSASCHDMGQPVTSLLKFSSVYHAASIRKWSDSDWKTRASRINETLLLQFTDQIAESQSKTLVHNGILYLVAPSLSRHNEAVNRIRASHDAFLEYVKNRMANPSQNPVVTQPEVTTNLFGRSTSYYR